jgi:hypothetical protein
MSEMMDKILAAKLKMRRELADLPFDQKLDLMEKMRERQQMLAENPLHYRAQAAKETESGKTAEKRKPAAKRFSRKGAEAKLKRKGAGNAKTQRKVRSGWTGGQDGCGGRDEAKGIRIKSRIRN